MTVSRMLLLQKADYLFVFVVASVGLIDNVSSLTSEKCASTENSSTGTINLDVSYADAVRNNNPKARVYESRTKINSTKVRVYEGHALGRASRIKISK